MTDDLKTQNNNFTPLLTLHALNRLKHTLLREYSKGLDEFACLQLQGLGNQCVNKSILDSLLRKEEENRE